MSLFQLRRRRRSRGRGLVFAAATAATFAAAVGASSSASSSARRSLSFLPPQLLPAAPRLPPPPLFSSAAQEKKKTSSSSSSEKREREGGGRGSGSGASPAAAATSSAAAAAAAEDNYGHFADLLASVLVLREGGISEAIDALPLLHDTTHAYVRTMSILQEHSSGSGSGSGSNGIGTGAKASPLLGAASAWQGLSESAALAIARGLPSTAKYQNYTDPLAKSGQQLQAALDAKWGPEPALGWERQWRFQQFNHTLSKLVPDVPRGPPGTATEEAIVLSALNAKLSQYNIEVSRKHVMPPSRFTNGAGVIAKHLAGLHIMNSAMTFAPCLISIHAAPVMLTGTAINIAPAAVSVMATGAMAWPQGINVQPALIYVAPMGANAQPQGE